jgi:hypothetical protein
MIGTLEDGLAVNFLFLNIYLIRVKTALFGLYKSNFGRAQKAAQA